MCAYRKEITSNIVYLVRKTKDSRYGLRQSKKSLGEYAKCFRFRAFCVCAKYHPDFFSPILHSMASNDFLEDSDGHDQTAQMRRLIRAFAARICPKPHFCIVQPINTSAYNNSACE